MSLSGMGEGEGRAKEGTQKGEHQRWQKTAAASHQPNKPSRQPRQTQNAQNNQQGHQQNQRKQNNNQSGSKWRSFFNDIKNGITNLFD